jgi:hypothetical protein
MIWGHNWAVLSPLTIATVVAKPEYRGTASGFAYMTNKTPLFLGVFLFPALFGAIGQTNATLLVAVFPLVGMLAAIFYFREMYGFEHH